MTKTRLVKLETALRQLHTRAWDRFQRTLVEPLDTLKWQTGFDTTEVLNAWFDLDVQVRERLIGEAQAMDLPEFEPQPDLERWQRWYGQIEALTPAIVSRDFELWPHHLPEPPPEFPGLWEHLVSQLRKHQGCDVLIATSLEQLAIARAVRTALDESL